MIFAFYLPEETYVPSKKRKHIISEAEYFAQDVEKLQDFRCPTCKEHALFRGGVYIGCRGCLNYFDEKEIIEENIKGE